MIERLITNRSAVMNVLMDRSITNCTTAQTLEISEIEWTMMESLAIVLKPFQVANTVLCADTQASTSMVRPVVFSLHNIHLSKSDDDITIIAEIKVSCDRLTKLRWAPGLCRSKDGEDLTQSKNIANSHR